MLEFMNVGFITEAVCFQLENIANNDSSVLTFVDKKVIIVLIKIKSKTVRKVNLLCNYICGKQCY